MNQLVSLLTCAALASSFSCKEEEDSPDLPPAASMNVQLDALNNAPLAAKNAPSGPTAAPEDYVNFANAWARVRIVQFFAGAVVVVPALSIGAALQQKPTKDGDLWKWNVTVGDARADLEVSASLLEGFDLDLYITNTELERFLWVEGAFGDGSGGGSWTLHDPKIEGTNTEALSIQWSYVSDTDRSLSYEIVSPLPNAQGEVVTGDTFTLTIDGMRATLEYVDADDTSVTAVISWDTATGAGSIIVPDFNQGQKACWDAAFENTGC